jgi:hypothetical protein
MSMAKFARNMSEFHTSWRKAKDEAVKKAKEVDKTTARKVEKWMKDEFDRGLGDRIDAAHKAFEGLDKAWGLAKTQLRQPAVHQKFGALLESTMVKVNPVVIVLDSYRQSLKAPYAKREIPPAVVAILLSEIESLQSKVDKAIAEFATMKKQYDEFIPKLIALEEGVDIQDFVAKYAPELLIK